MFTINASDLYRAMVAAMEVAKLASSDVPILQTLHLQTTTEGLQVEATDRHQIVRTWAEYATGSTGEPMEAALLSISDAKALTPLLRKQKHDPVDITPGEGTISFTLLSGIHVEYETVQGGYPNLSKFSTEVAETLDYGTVLELNPALFVTLSRLKTLDKRGTVLLSTEETGKPIRWAFSTWAAGLVMPVRPEPDDLTARRETFERLSNAEPLDSTPRTVAA